VNAIEIEQFTGKPEACHLCLSLLAAQVALDRTASDCTDVVEWLSGVKQDFSTPKNAPLLADPVEYARIGPREAPQRTDTMRRAIVPAIRPACRRLALGIDYGIHCLRVLTLVIAARMVTAEPAKRDQSRAGTWSARQDAGLLRIRSVCQTTSLARLLAFFSAKPDIAALGNGQASDSRLNFAAQVSAHRFSATILFQSTDCRLTFINAPTTPLDVHPAGS
jgi:hypothetical protein